jgi:hypothetical protein
MEDLAEARVKVEAALAAAEAEREAAAEVKRLAAVEATERAAHWAGKMDKALSYRRNVDRREADYRAQTEHRLERRWTVRRSDAAICNTMMTIDTVGAVDNGDGAALL